MPRKIFTAGEVLAASDVNSFLMDQSVMTFTDSTARGSAIGTAVAQEGMLTYLEDTNDFEYWDGTAFEPIVAPASTSGLEFITTSTFTGVASASFGSDASPIFSSTFDNYRIIIESAVSSSIARTFSLRLRSNTTDETSGNYRFANSGIDGALTARNSGGFEATSTTILSNGHYTFNRYLSIIDINSPFEAAQTAATGMNAGIDVSGNWIHQSFSFQLNTSTSYNGFTILNSSGDFTSGKMTVYGYRKA